MHRIIKEIEINKSGEEQMNTETAYLDGAKWIGSPKSTSNTDWVDTYAVTADFEIISSRSAHIAVAARNRDFYVHIEINEKFAAVSEVYDGVKNLCGKYNMNGVLAQKNRVRIEVNRTLITLILNGETIINGEDIMPRDRPNKPRKAHMMCFGLPQREGEVHYSCIKLENTYNGEVYRESTFADDTDVLAQLGTVKDGCLVVKEEFNLINPVPPVTVKKEFTPRTKVKSAYLYATARGFYDAYVNGERVNDTFYNPGFTDYRKRIYYQTYDVTDMIKDGANTTGAVVTKGYYSGFVGYSGAMVYGRQNTFLGALAIEYADGTHEVIKTDETWLFTDRGAVIDADYQQGEMYDARYELDMNGDSKVWTRCGAYEYPKYAVPTNGTLDNEPFELNAEPSVGAVAERTLKPTGEAREIPEGHFVLDLGQNMVGTVRVVMNGRRGRCIKLRYGEMCYSDGRIYNENYRSAANIDTYTMKGGREEFMPAFTSHGFRYIEISGCGERLTREDFDDMIVSVEGVVITNTTEVTGSFECSNPDINKLFENILWGQRGNSVMTFTDCPQRNERMGWTGDMQVFAKTAVYNMDIRSFMKKWLTDLRDSQLMYNRDGAVPDTAPLGGDTRPPGGCDGWGDAAVIVPWEMYKAYGDTKFLSDNYGMMKKWVDYQQLSENQTNFIQRRQRRGDHLAPDATTPIILSATAYAANSANILSRAADVLGYADDAEKYRALFENIKAAFKREWVTDDGQILYVPESGDTKNDRDLELNGDTKTDGDTKIDGDTKVNASQTAYALAIDFDLLDGVKDGTRTGFKKALDDWGGKLSVGFLGISHLLNALRKAGMTDEAFALLESTEYPGWLYSVRNGATTVWERWNSYIAETDTFGDFNMNSFNHYAYGAVGEWLYSDILGINTSEEKGETGYKKIILRPTCGGTLTYAKGSLKTQCGVIKSEWSVTGGKFNYRCSVPENTTAELHLGDKKIPLKAGEYEFEI